MRPPRITLQWVMAMLAVLAIPFSLGARFGLNVLAPATLLIVFIIVSPPGRRSPIALIAWVGGALIIPLVCAVTISKVLWGDYLGVEWPILYAACSMVELFPLILVLGVDRMP